MDAMFTAPRSRLDLAGVLGVPEVRLTEPWASCGQCAHYVKVPAYLPDAGYAWCDEVGAYTGSAEDPEAVGCGAYDPRGPEACR